jgi:hypothetical protein
MLAHTPAPVLPRTRPPLFRVLALLTCLLPAAVPAAAQQADQTPSGMVAFFMFSGAGCPAGWIPYAPGAGKLLLAVTNPQAVGGGQGDPMPDRTAPLHTHTFSTTVTITQKSIEADTGKNNHDAARSDETPAVPNNPPGTTNGGTGESTNLPFIQLVVCQKQ